MKDLFTAFTATGVIQLANLASGILAARLLLPQGRGELAAIVLWPALIAALGGFSINSAAGYFAAGGRRAPGEIFAVATALAALLTPLLIAAGLGILNEAYRDMPEVRDTARLYLAFVPANLFGLCYLSILQGRLRIGTFNVLRALQSVAYVALIGIALGVGQATVGGFAAASLGASFIVLALAVAVLARLGWIGWHVPADLVRPLVRYAASVHVSSVLSALSQRLDQALIALMLPAASLGLYAVALSSGGVAQLIGTTIETLAFPKVAAANPAVRADVLGRYIRAAVGLAVLAAAVLVPLLPLLIPLFFGEAFRPAAAPAQVLAVGAVFFAFRMTMCAGLRAHDRALLTGRIEALCLVALAGALAVLLPRYGILGCAFAIAGAHLFACLLLAGAVRGALGVSIWRLFTPTARDAEIAAGLLRRVRG